MFGSHEGAMADAAAVPQIGCRTLCQHPGCGKPIQELAVVPGAWVHIEGIRGPEHDATPVEPEHPGEQLVGRAVASVHTYQRGRREGLEDLAAQLRELAGNGVDEFSAGLRHAAREAVRCAGGER